MLWPCCVRHDVFNDGDDKTRFATTTMHTYCDILAEDEQMRFPTRHAAQSRRTCACMCVSHNSNAACFASERRHQRRSHYKETPGCDAPAPGDAQRLLPSHSTAAHRGSEQPLAFGANKQLSGLSFGRHLTDQMPAMQCMTDPMLVI
jgi:hypothetical protein